MKPKVTVIIPSYNHARYLPKRIESILNQSYINYELMIIDDCSPDDSDAVIRLYTDNPKVEYYRNEVNSGTPFSAWGRGADMAQGEYIWICESDDFAHEDFLKHAVEALDSDPDNVLYYCNSNVVNENDEIIGNTANYFRDVWQDSRWTSSFKVNGTDELKHFQLMGQTVPNMSSALIRKEAFRNAYSDYLLKFKLTGDWLFIGLVMLYGNVVFDVNSYSNFREHQVTSRARVKSDRSQAEFILTKYYLHRVLGGTNEELPALLSRDFVRHIYEDASAMEVIKRMFQISVGETLSLGFKMAWQLPQNKEYIQKFFERWKNAKKLQS